jgi:hypothetical protein
MSADRLSLAATIILLLPMIYFLFTSLTFFLARFTDPVVTRMLRGLFNSYFLAILAAGTLGTAAFLAAGRPAIAADIAIVVILAFLARTWFIRRIDAQIAARDAGDAAALARLRQIHLGGIAWNAAHTAALVISIPYLFPKI